MSLQYEDKLQKLGLWTLEERRNRADLIKVFKMAHGFYRAMLCIRGTSHGPVSGCLCLCLSVSVCHKSEFYYNG